VSAAMQATDISSAIAQWTSWSFHGPIIFYTIRDIGTDPTNVDDNMGMLDYSGTPKPVFAAVQQQLAAAAVPAPTAPPATTPPTPPTAPPEPKVALRIPNIVGGLGKVAKPARGTVTMRIPVTLDSSSTVAVSVRFTTASVPPNVNARSGVDYVAKAGVLTFAPGQTRLFVTVTILAHSRRVPNDLFIVRFSDPSHAVLGGYGIGVGLIT
jgi:Calx-beta domain